MIKQTTYYLPSKFGLIRTLQLMQTLEHAAVNDPNFRRFVLANFNSNCNNCTKKLYEKIWNFVRTNFKYVNDTEHGAHEVLTSPQKMLLTRSGDCDDFSLFIQSVLKVLGKQTNYVLAGSEKGYTHIFVYSEGFILDGACSIFNYIDKKYKYLKPVKP